MAYLLGASIGNRVTAKDISFVFIGDTIQINGLGRCDSEGGDAGALYDALILMSQVVDKETLLCPAHDYLLLFNTTLALESQKDSLLSRVIEQTITKAEFIAEKQHIDEQLPPSDFQQHCGFVKHVANHIEHVQPNHLVEFIKTHPDCFIVDVREPHEFDAYPGEKIADKSMVNIPLTQITQFVANHKADQAQFKYVCICRSGKRSEAAAQTMQRNGFEHVYHVPGGFALLNTL